MWINILVKIDLLYLISYHASLSLFASNQSFSHLFWLKTIIVSLHSVPRWDISSETLLFFQVWASLNLDLQWSPKVDDLPALEELQLTERISEDSDFTESQLRESRVLCSSHCSSIVTLPVGPRVSHLSSQSFDPVLRFALLFEFLSSLSFLSFGMSMGILELLQRRP